MSIAIGEVRVDPATGQVDGPEGRGRLGAREATLLRLLIAASPDPVPHATIRAEVWPDGLAEGSRAPGMLLAALRRKLEPRSPGRHLKTIRGKGVALVDLALPDPAADLPLVHGPGPFVGRAAAVAAVLRFVGGAAPWLTITGMGGAGKTRLAAEAAEVLRTGGATVAWADLAPVSDVDAGLVVVARALGVDPAPGVPLARALRDALRGRRLVLVVDNLEHLPGVAEPLRRALTVAPRVRVVATSRVALGVDGEALLRLDGLTDPADADHLFRALALAAAPGLREPDGTLVRRIGALLHGHPLSIELAAATLRRRPATALLVALEQGVDGLEAAEAGRPERQRSLEATFAYSLAILAPAQQRALSAASVFAGEFTTADAAEAVEVPRHALTHLVRHSLMDSRGPDRWRLHPMVRALAARARPPDVETRYRRWFLTWASGIGRRMTSRDGHRAVRDRLADLDQAWSSAVAARDWDALTAGWRGLRVWVECRHDHRSATRWFAAAAPALVDPGCPPELARALRTTGGRALALSGRHAAGRAVLETIGGPDVAALCALAEVRVLQGDVAAADRLLDRAAARAEADGDPMATARVMLARRRRLTEAMRGDRGEALVREALALLGDDADPGLRRAARVELFTTLRASSRLDEAEVLGEALLAEARRLGDDGLFAQVAYDLAWVRRYRGQPEEAAALLAENIETLTALGWHAKVPGTLSLYGSVLLELGELDEAEAVIADGLARSAAYDRNRMVANCLIVRGFIAIGRGRPEEAVLTFDAAAETLLAIFPDEPYQRALCAGNRAWAQWMVPDAEAARASLDRVLPLLPGLDHSLRHSLHVLDALLLADAGEHAAAHARAAEALAEARAVSDHVTRRALVHHAGVLARTGHAPLAAALAEWLAAGPPYVERFIYRAALDAVLVDVPPAAPIVDLDDALARVEAAYRSTRPPG